jgi:Zn-dependent M28 family amino/carboxypeptidase
MSERNVSRAAAAAFFARAPRPIEEVFAAAGRGEAQAFDLGLEVSLSGACEISEVASANVLGWLPGTDPALVGEPLVVTAHLDHLGISAVGQGDLIHNGALDNALGIAVILAVAEELSVGPRLVRPVLFAALTAEEKGLLGAYHLSRHPPTRVQRFAANLNIDMPVVLAPVRDVVGLGAEHSTWGEVLAEAAARQGFTVSPDPLPEEVRFVRSDQYPFVRIGVPALAITMGQKGPADGPDLVALNQDFRRHRYHRPSDDLHQPIDWPSAAALTRLVLDVVAQITSSAAAPQWNPGDFFGTRFGSGGRAESPAPAPPR